MILRQLFDRDTWTYTYLLADPETRDAIIIDPVAEQVDRDVAIIEELGLNLRYSLETHVHADHVTGGGALRDRLGCETVVSSAANVECANVAIEDGGTLAFGSCSIEARHTPGHTDTCVTWVSRDADKTYAFTGDALFIRGCGRTDFQQGSSHKLYRSVHDQIFTLPDDAVVYPGHDYKGRTSSTVGEEKAHNPRLNTAIDEPGFVRIMDALNLAPPKRIHEALPANMACGRVSPTSPVAA